MAFKILTWKSINIEHKLKIYSSNNFGKRYQNQSQGKQDVGNDNDKVEWLWNETL